MLEQIRSSRLICKCLESNVERKVFITVQVQVLARTTV
jgi:hypothetical protein